MADGRLSDPDRRAELQRLIDASPELSAAYERERRVVLALAEARRERAPEALRRRIEAERPGAAVRLRWRVRYGVALAGAAAAVLLVIALALPGGSGGPSVSQAAELALRGAVAAGPAADPSAPAIRLDKASGALYFPIYRGWTAVGQRTDTFYGRRAVTVYYRRGRQVVAYTILALPALREPAGPANWYDGVRLQTLHLHARVVITWREAGQTCILSATGVSRQTLDTLASGGPTPIRADSGSRATYA